MKTELNNLYNSLVFYRYFDEDFYKKVKTLCQDMEDFIVLASSKKFNSLDQVDFNNEVDSKLGKIYLALNDKYKNG